VFHLAGLTEADRQAVRTAVSYHCLPEELPRDHPHWRATALLKDADGLDRVRLGDLDPRFLRFPAAHDMIDFATRMFERTNHRIAEGPNHYEQLVQEVRQLLAIL
jgi:hypothetical protein